MFLWHNGNVSCNTPQYTSVLLFSFPLELPILSFCVTAGCRLNMYTIYSSFRFVYCSKTGRFISPHRIFRNSSDDAVDFVKQSASCSSEVTNSTSEISWLLNISRSEQMSIYNRRSSIEFVVCTDECNDSLSMMQTIGI